MAYKIVGIIAEDKAKKKQAALRAEIIAKVENRDEEIARIAAKKKIMSERKAYRAERKKKSKERKQVIDDLAKWFKQTSPTLSDSEAIELAKKEMRNSQREKRVMSEEEMLVEKKMAKVEELERWLEYIGEINPDPKMEQWIRTNTRIIVKENPGVSARAARKQAIRDIKEEQKK